MPRAFKEISDVDAGGRSRAAKSQRGLKRPHHGLHSRAPPSTGSFGHRISGISDSKDDDDFFLDDDDFGGSSQTSRLRRKGKTQRVLKRPQHQPQSQPPPSIGSFGHNPKPSKAAAALVISDFEHDDFDLIDDDFGLPASPSRTSRSRRKGKTQRVLKRPQHRPQSRAPPSTGSFRHNSKPSKAAASTGLSDSDDDDFDLTNLDSDLPASFFRRISRPRSSSEVKSDASKVELEAAGALTGLRLKKAGKKSGTRIVSEGGAPEFVAAKDANPPEVVAAKDANPDSVPIQPASLGGKAPTSSQPGPAGTADLLVPAEPGCGVPRARTVPGSTCHAGNQTGASCIRPAWFSRMQATKRAHSEPWMLLRVNTLPEIFAPPQLVNYNKAFGTDRKEKLLTVHVPGSGEATEVALGTPKINVSSEAIEEGKLAKGEKKSPQASGKDKPSVQSDVRDGPFDPEDYERSLWHYDPDHLARITATLGYKAVIAGKVAIDRLQEKEKAALSCSARVLELEAEVARLKKENSILDNIKASLSEENVELRKNTELLLKTCSDLVEKVEILEKNSQDNLGVLEKLRSTIERDSMTIASLKKDCAEQVARNRLAKAKEEESRGVTVNITYQRRRP